MAINLRLDEQQQLIQDSAREFFGKSCSPAVVRAYHNNPAEFPDAVWREMAELGWLGMSLPAAYGGLECSFLDTFALYVEMGRSLAPTPHLATIEQAALLIAELGSEEQKKRLLPRIIRGDVMVSLALMEPEGLYGPEGVGLPARRDGDRFILDLTKVLVPNLASAELLLCAVRTGSGKGPAGISLLLVDSRAPGIEVEPTPNIGGYPLYTVSFNDVTVSAKDAVGEIDGIWPALDRVLMRAAVLQSAMVVGAGERILEMAANYAKTRVQFDEPIGKHQAVQYLVSDIAIHEDITRVTALQAAWRISVGKPFLREAALAKAAANRATAAMTHAAHEVHAGIAFMEDYDLQLYTRRGKHWETNLGDTRYHLDRAVAEGGTDPGLDAADALSAR